MMAQWIRHRMIHGDYSPEDIPIQSSWHYYKVHKQLQLYMEEFTVLLQFDKIDAIW